MKRLLKLCLLTGGIILVFAVFDVGCLIKDIIGIPCAGCGMTRAWLSLLHGDMAGAFFWHPLFWLAPPLILLALWDKNFKGKAAILITGIALFIAVYIYRMVIMFPNIPPMDINRHAPVINLIHLIIKK